MPRTVLVTGATGNIGSPLILRLSDSTDLDARAFVRDEGKATSLREAGIDCVLGTFEDPKAVSQAVADIDTVVLITARNPNANEQARAVLTAAKTAGVRKIVRISEIKASLDGPTENSRIHGQTDHDIESSGFNYVILRPHFLMQNINMAYQSIVAEGTFWMGMGDGRLGMIDSRDVIDCAEQLVLSDEFDNQIFEPTGPESISFHDVANILVEALGRPVDYIAVPLEMIDQFNRDMGMSDWFADVMRDYSKAYSENWGNFVTDDVERITGHTTRSFDMFVREDFAPSLMNRAST